MFSGTVFPIEGTDSMHITNAINGSTATGSLMDLPYFRHTDPKSPLMYPGLESSVLARFPPSLLISATRDPVMSSVIATHSELTRLGVKTDLHVWEGQAHCFLYDPDMRESRDAYRIVAEFFAGESGREA